MEYLSYSEIFRQPDTWEKTFEAVSSEAKAVVGNIKAYNPGRILVIACGSSYWGALSGGRALQKETGIHVDVITGGDMLLNYNELIGKDERILILAPSRTGKTKEIVNAVQSIKEQYDCFVLNIGCTLDSPLAGLSDADILMPWVHETSICQTRSFTNLYMAQLILAASWSGSTKLLNQLEQAVAMGVDYISRVEGMVREIAGKSWADGFVLANGDLYGIGCEGALILQEMSQTPMDFYQTFEYRHGPIVLTGEKSLVVLLQTAKGFSYEKQFIDEIKAKNASLLILGDIKNRQECSCADYYIAVGNDEWDDYIKGIYYITILQMLAYYKALVNGRNPDEPCDLVQWIDLK